MPGTIGQRLKREREARYLSLEKAAEETRIRRVFLQALEADDFSVMPSAAQGRGFLRNYAEYLDLDIDELIAEIQRNPIPPAEVSGPLPQPSPITSHSSVQITAFWNTIGSNHQSPTSVTPPIPGVSDATATNPPTYKMSFTT